MLSWKKKARGGGPSEKHLFPRGMCIAGQPSHFLAEVINACRYSSKYTRNTVQKELFCFFLKGNAQTESTPQSWVVCRVFCYFAGCFFLLFCLLNERVLQEQRQYWARRNQFLRTVSEPLFTLATSAISHTKATERFPQDKLTHNKNTEETAKELAFF